MEIKGIVHCFFEQSGTFKNEFIKLGIPAEDYDIQNNFGQTDHMDDLFKAIEDAYDGKTSMFDNISKDDLIMAFFPCIYFCNQSQSAMTLTYNNYASLTLLDKYQKILKRQSDRYKYFQLITKMYAVCHTRGLRLIIENPATPPHYLLFAQNFVTQPTLIDHDRTLRGDFFKKPTAYWFVNCEPTNGKSYEPTSNELRKTTKSCAGNRNGGVCNEERSLISPDYARNFICDFILGKRQKNTLLTLF